MKVIFLDIDGVLNVFVGYKAPILPGPVGQLNRVLLATDADLVISSTWRHLVHNGHMDLFGFEFLLRSHGLTAANVIGVTEDSSEGRGWQIRAWLIGKAVEKYVILDDMIDGQMAKMPFVCTNGSFGLTEADADKLIEVLNG